MKVSALMVTQPGRIGSAEDAMRCFAAQSYEDRELVVVHDGGPDLDRQLVALTSRHQIDARIHQAESAPLGGLRNTAVGLAEGALVCQWDDDDLYHPERIAAQVAQLEVSDAAACFMTDQLHLFTESGELFWDDWTVEAFPGCFIQGSLLARIETMPTYPEISRGEDTQIVTDLIAGGHRVTSLQLMGQLYVYRFTGQNVWSEEHHREISNWKHRSEAQLRMEIEELRKALTEYPVPRRSVRMRVGDDFVDLALGD